MSRLSVPRRVVAAALVVGLAASTAGVLIDAHGFVLSLLADIVDVIAGGLAGVFVIDRVNERARHARWRLVSQSTLWSIRTAVIEGALTIYDRLPAPRPPSADPVMTDANGRLVDGLENLRCRLNELEPWDYAPTAREMLDAFAAHVRVVREIALPRLLAIGAEPELVRALVSLELSYQQLEHSAHMETRLGVPAAARRDLAVRLIADMQAIARKLDTLNEA